MKKLSTFTAALTVLGAAVGFVRPFGIDHIIAPVLAAWLIGLFAGVLAVFSRRRITRSTWCLLGVIGAAACTAAFFSPASDAGLSTNAFVGIRGLFQGWHRILVTTLPAPATADRIGAIAGLTALATSCACLLASRPARVAMIPAILLFCAGLSLGVHGSGNAIWMVLPLLAFLALHLVCLRHECSEGTARPSRSISSVGIAFVAALLVAGTTAHGTGLTNGREPRDPRGAIDTSAVLSQVRSPLDVSINPVEVVFQARIDNEWIPTPWRIASFDIYDGQHWTLSGRFRTTGDVVIPSPHAEGPTIRAAVSVQDLEGPWIPTAGIVTGVQPADMQIDTDTDTVVDPRSGAQRRYDITTTLPAPDAQALTRASVPTGSRAAALTATPSCLPQTLQHAAQQQTSTRSLPAEKAVAIEKYLSINGGFALDTSAGGDRSCAGLETFMDEQTGTEEQFAMAYVLMARASGLPARLVSGYRPGTYDTNTHTVTVRSSDAYVWPEVSFTNIGWIAFNPVPASSAVPPPPPPLPALEELREAEPRHPTETAQPNADHDGDADGERSRSSLAVAGVASILVATIVVVAWRLPRMLRTRRRRRVDDATHRTRGAWHEVVDILEAHKSVRRSMTTEEIGLHLREFADLHDAVVDLGRLNERIVYADHTATATEAETSWQTVRTVRKLSRRRGTRVR